MNYPEFHIVDNQVVISLTGNLQGELAAKIRETILRYIADGYFHFKVDFSQVTDINATGLGMLVNVQKRARQNGGNIIINGLHGTVQTVFDRTRLSKAFAILPDNS
ncbi:STAS domain-containing protein [Sporomusa sphaeroides]|uniref:STAS domain-containing protein n=1 Tax=Sporomusa sphaeroides TaxID=47679 RepID=UPI003DA1286A